MIGPYFTHFKGRRKIDKSTKLYRLLHLLHEHASFLAAISARIALCNDSLLPVSKYCMHVYSQSYRGLSKAFPKQTDHYKFNGDF